MILVKIFKFKYILSQVKVIPQKQHQISHELLIVEDHALQHVRNNLIRREINLRRLSGELFYDLKCKGVKGANLCRDSKPLVDSLLQFTDCLVGIRNHDDLFWIHLFSLYQIFHFRRHRSGFTSSGTGYQQTVIVVCDDGTPLLVIQTDIRVDLLQNVIEVLSFLLQYLFYIRGVMRGHIPIQRVHFSQKCLQRRHVDSQGTGMILDILVNHPVF